MFENTAITIFPLNRPLCKDIIPWQRLTKEWLESVCMLNLEKQVYKTEFVGELVVITLQLKVACRLKAKLKNVKHTNYHYLMQSPFHYKLVSHCSGKQRKGKFGETEGKSVLTKNQYFRLPHYLRVVASISETQINEKCCSHRKMSQISKGEEDPVRAREE